MPLVTSLTSAIAPSKRFSTNLNRMHLLNRSWCHTRELHLAQGELMRSIKRRCPGVRCLFSRERSPHYHSSTSRGTTEYQIGIDSCGLQPENDSKRSASGPMQARFQHTRWPSLGSIHVKHRDAGRKIFLWPLYSSYTLALCFFFNISLEQFRYLSR
jgi:hypothetical protein